MTKNIATVEGLSPSELISQMHQLGFGLQCPDTGHAVGFSAEGDGPIGLATDEVSGFLVEGSGVLLWRGASDSLYLSLILGKPRIYFDGLTATQEEALCNSLTQLGVCFSVAREDSAYEA